MPPLKAVSASGGVIMTCLARALILPFLGPAGEVWGKVRLVVGWCWINPCCVLGGVGEHFEVATSSVAGCCGGSVLLG